MTEDPKITFEIEFQRGICDVGPILSVLLIGKIPLLDGSLSLACSISKDALLRNPSLLFENAKMLEESVQQALQTRNKS